MTQIAGFPIRTLAMTCVAATLVAGALDLSGAMLLAGLDGRTPMQVLQSIAGSVMGRAAYRGGLVSAALGLAIHFSIMALMAASFVALAVRHPVALRMAVASGALYGVVLFGMMYFVVLPLRWPALFPTADAKVIAGQLACHIVLVGIPLAVLTATLLGQRRLTF